MVCDCLHVEEGGINATVTSVEVAVGRQGNVMVTSVL